MWTVIGRYQCRQDTIQFAGLFSWLYLPTVSMNATVIIMKSHGESLLSPNKQLSQNNAQWFNTTQSHKFTSVTVRKKNSPLCDALASSLAYYYNVLAQSLLTWQIFLPSTDTSGCWSQTLHVYWGAPAPQTLQNLAYTKWKTIITICGLFHELTSMVVMQLE